MENINFKEATNLLHDHFSCLHNVTKFRDIILSPRYIGRSLLGIRELLDQEINLYSEVLQGVLISYNNIWLLQPLSLTHDDKPYLNFRIQADFIVFRPLEGCMLKGVVNKTSKDHVGCLVHRHFNASIPRLFRFDGGTWKGSQLRNGDEFSFKVTSVSANNKVLFIQGTLLDEFILNKSNTMTETVCKSSESHIKDEEQDNITSNKKRKKKRMQEADDLDLDLPVTHLSADGQTLSRKSKKKKRKFSKETETDTDSGIVDSDSVPAATDSQVEVSAVGEEESKYKRKRKHSYCESSVDSITAEPQSKLAKTSHHKHTVDDNTSVSSDKSKKKKKKHKHKNKIK